MEDEWRRAGDERQLSASYDRPSRGRLHGPRRLGMFIPAPLVPPVRKAGGPEFHDRVASVGRSSVRREVLALLFALSSAPAAAASATEGADLASAPDVGAVTAEPSGDAPAGAPLGPALEYGTLPEAVGWPRACSFRHRACVRPSPGTPSGQTLAALAAVDRVWDALTEVLALPAPDGGLDGPWSIYLVDDVEGGGTARLRERDALAHFDRAASFGLVDRSLHAGPVMDRAVAQAVARGSLWQGAPNTDEGSARAEVEMLVRLVIPSGSTGDEAVFQAQPERTLVDPTSLTFDRGAALFFDWLDATFGAEPGAIVSGMWSLAATRTPAGATHWQSEPNGFDVLRVSLKGAVGTESTLEDVFARFAIDRALQQPAVHLGWHIPWPSTARRLSAPREVHPTGASYVLVDHRGAPPTAKLRLEADWEDYERMRWFAIKLDTEGHAKAVLPITSMPRGTHASFTVETHDGIDGVLVVGANVASTEHGFDPDQGEWEPHGWLLTVDAE